MKDTEQTIHTVKGLPVLLLDQDQMAGHEHTRELQGFVSGLLLYPENYEKEEAKSCEILPAKCDYVLRPQIDIMLS